MRHFARIESADETQTLEAVPVEKDVRLILTNAGMRLDLRLSGLMRASFTRPWDYQALDFNEVTCDACDRAVVVSGSSDEFAATARFEFKGNALRCTCSWKALSGLGMTFAT